MRGLFTSALAQASIVLQDKQRAISRHFGSHIGGSLSGIYDRLPFTRLSAFIEWRGQSVGFGHERGAEALEVFAGRLQGVFSIELKAV